MEVQTKGGEVLLQLSLDIEYWSNWDILLLMDGLLRTTIHDLKDMRASDDLAKEALDWVMSDDILPFSFAVCCRAIGYDHERLREAILASIPRIFH